MADIYIRERRKVERKKRFIRFFIKGIGISLILAGISLIPIVFLWSPHPRMEKTEIKGLQSQLKKSNLTNPFQQITSILDAVDAYSMILEKAKENKGNLNEVYNNRRLEILEDWFFPRLQNLENSDPLIRTFQKVTEEHPEIINENRITVMIAKEDFYCFPLYLREAMVILVPSEVTCHNCDLPEAIGENVIIRIVK